MNNEELIVIPNDYPDLHKYKFDETIEPNNPPEELINLLKAFIPVHVLVGMNWDKNNPRALAQSDQLHKQCNIFKKKVFEFDYLGIIVFKINGYHLSVNIYYSDIDSKEKVIDYTATKIIEYDFKFEQPQLHKGLVFTSKYFKGRIEVLEVNKERNELKVKLNADSHGNKSVPKQWFDTFILSHTYNGLERGEYFIIDSK